MSAPVHPFPGPSADVLGWVARVRELLDQLVDDEIKMRRTPAQRLDTCIALADGYVAIDRVVNRERVVTPGESGEGAERTQEPHSKRRPTPPGHPASSAPSPPPPAASNGSVA